MEKQEKQTMWRSNTEGEPKRRHMLKEILPLDTPLSLDIEASGGCCLKCAYCPQSLPIEKKMQINIGKGIMEYSLFEKIVENCLEFNDKLKSIRFAGFGEPLLNRELPRMVKLVKEKQIAESVIIFTNGVALTKEISDALVDAGVDTFLFDIQGTCVEDYVKNANTKIDFDKLVENLTYLYKKKKRGKIFVKTFKFIIEKQRERFFEIFEPISDEIGIENIYEIYNDIDYTGMITEEKETCGVDFYKSKYCSYPFFQMAINAYGMVTACTLPVSKNNEHLIIGDATKQSLKEIWEGKKLNDIRRLLLEDRNKCKACAECKYTDLLPKEDLIDDMVEELKLYCSRREESYGK